MSAEKHVGNPPCDHDAYTPCPPECREAKKKWRRDAMRELSAMQQSADESMPIEERRTFYDAQMRVAVEQALDYLLTKRGQREMRRAAEESQEFADKFRRMRNVSWERLHARFTI